MEFIYKNFSDSRGNDQEEEERGYSETIVSEQEAGPKTKDILTNNKPKESDKIFATMQDLRMPTKYMVKMKELKMY